LKKWTDLKEKIEKALTEANAAAAAKAFEIEITD